MDGSHTNGQSANRDSLSRDNFEAYVNSYVLTANFTVQRALDIARESEEGVHPVILEYLEEALQDVWARVEASPNTYVMNKDEFALFNYFRARFDCSTAQAAVRRFWDNCHAGDNSSTGTINGASHG